MPATHAAELIPLGFLPGSENSGASDVSDDGSVVVGASDGGFRDQDRTSITLYF